jgi:hypothetical protein
VDEEEEEEERGKFTFQQQLFADVAINRISARRLRHWVWSTLF